MEETGKRKLMTVRQMGDLLGLKKTERYYLAKKGFFEVVHVNEKMWVVCESFEKWYANQVKYKKVTGEEPGKELKEWSYSPREIAQLLGIDETTAYDLINDNQIETVIVDYWKRVPKEAFEKWYRSQTRHRTKSDWERDAAIESITVSMPEMARLLGVERETVYGILRNPKFIDVFEVVIVAERRRITKRSLERFLKIQDKYRLAEDRPINIEENMAEKKELLTQTEAARIAGVSRTTIIRWLENGYFHSIAAGNIIRIPRQSFEQWLKQRMEAL